ncbi:MAG: AraC family transcriptional regulator [Acetatifactor sp.]|nr:AraC family transcriptional regulator [Acetatifactor sp.]
MENPKKSIAMFPVAPPFDVAYRKETVSYPVGPHSHNAAELYFTLTDLPDVLLGDTVSAVPAGTLLIIPTFCIHQLYHEAGIKYERYILTIPTDWLKVVFCEGSSAFSYLENTGIPLLVIPEKQQKKELLHRFNELLSFSNRTSPEALVSLFQFLSMLQEMVAKNTPNAQSALPISPSQKRVNDIIAYLNDHLLENPSITNLASHFYLNPDYLSRLFKAHMHVSIGHYITLQKISHAEALLRDGKSVTQVQEALGYSSYAYFFKTFQRITGVSPSKYRSQYQNPSLTS